MKNFAFILGLVVILHLAAFAQVDTLRLQEISSFTTTDRIYQTSFKDINNDSLLEMIICQRDWIDIYNPLDGDLLWTSPPLGRNSATWKVEFGDLNNDGFADLAVSDSASFDPSYVKIFDVLHDSLLWTSPNLHALQKCIAIGDRNSDGSNDIIIFTRGSVHYQNTDTAWVDIYDGPNFQLNGHQQFSILSDWVADPDFYLGFSVQRREDLYRAAVIDFADNGQSQLKIVLFLNETRYGCTYDGIYYFVMNKSAGSYKIFDPISLANINITGYGGMQSYLLNENSQGEVSLSSYTKYSYRMNIFDPYGGYDQYYYHTKLNSELLSVDGSLPHTTMIDAGAGCSDGVVGDIDLSNAGDEFCAGFLDSLMVFSFPAGQRLRSTVLIRAWDADYYLFHSASIMGFPQILCANRWQFPVTTINGTTGEISAIFPYDTLHTPIIIDLNNDGDDEIVKIASITNIRIYRVVDALNGINNDIGQIPTQFKLYSAYPNPFNPSITISYDLVRESTVNIGIYDILGKRIATLLNQNQPAGHHQIKWNANDISSGIYFYKIQAGDYSETKKMLLLK